MTVLALGAVLLAGCAASTARPQSGPGSTSTPVGTGFLATDDSTYASFIQWTDAAGSISGTVQEDAVTGTAPSEQFSTNTVSVHGTVTGAQISLTFEGSDQMFGTFSAGTLRLNIPQSDGSLAAVTFHSASPIAFNQAVTLIQQQISSSNQAAASAQQIQSQQSAIDNAAAAVNKAIANLASDQLGITAALATLPKTMGQEQHDLATTAAAEQNVVTEAHNGTNQNQVCTDSDGVATDADGVASDADAVSSNADSVESAVSSARDDVSALQQDLQALQAAQRFLPGYRDGAPTPAEVNQAAAGADTAIRSAVATTNEDIGVANQYATKAYQDAQAAAASDSCAAPAQPYTQPTIS